VASLDAIDAHAPVILVANEMLDCLPVRQFMRTAEGWAERCVGVDEAGDLIFGLTVAPAGFTPPPYPVEIGKIVETSPHQAQFGRDCAALLVQATGAALLIDYGRDQPGPGDTLQALSRHKAVDPLAGPGEADLTQWADFPAVLAAAASAGAAVTPSIGQGDFLRAMGIEVRAARLKEARPDGAALLDRQMNRLIADEEMGRLFKACAIFAPTDLTMPGFET
jgi:SAM-dependent MidA family methyltransferase